MKPTITFFLSAIIMLSIFSCSKDAVNSAATNDTGQGGSLARFTIVGNYLYAVDNYNLYTYDITNPQNPVKTNSKSINANVETIFPFKNRLFIGSSTGMFIYSIDTPSVPSKLGSASHLRSCDPVVANDTVAFITLKGNTRCGPAQDGLYVNDIKNVFQPVLKNTILISTPEGLGLKDTTLFVCCNANGLRIFNVSNPYNPIERKLITGANYRDVIPFGNLLICYVTTGIMLYDISNPVNPVTVKFISN